MEILNFIWFSTMQSKRLYVRFYDMGQSSLLNKGQQRDCRSLNALKGSKRISCKVYSGSSDGYVIGSEEDITGISRIEEAATNVLIPGLPDGSNGEYGAPIVVAFGNGSLSLMYTMRRLGVKTWIPHMYSFFLVLVLALSIMRSN